MPSTEAKAREAVDAALRENSRGPETAQTGLWAAFPQVRGLQA